MTLEELINNINNFDENLVIFQKDKLSIDSEVYLFNPEDDKLTETKERVEYIYFLEVDMAKDFINEYVNTQITRPESKEIALRLLQYAIYDA